MTLSPGLYRIHSSKTHYAFSNEIGDPVLALPFMQGAINQEWRVVPANEGGDNAYAILPFAPKPGAFAIEGGVRPGVPISFAMPPATFFITPKDEDKHIYVISPTGGPIGVRYAVVVKETDSDPMLVVDSFPLDSAEPLPGWVFTAVHK